MSDNPEMLLLMAQLLQSQQELADLKNKPQKPRTTPKKVNGALYIPMNRSGEYLKKVSEMTEEEITQFKAKNLRKRANDLRNTAAWNLKEAQKLEAQAQELYPYSESSPVNNIEDDETTINQSITD